MSGCHVLNEKLFGCMFGCHPALENCADCCNKLWKENIEKRLEKLEGLLDFTKNLLNTKIHLDEKLGTYKKPYCCPVCNGEGINKNKLVSDGVKEPNTINMKNPVCKSCEGKGIVWNE